MATIVAAAVLATYVPAHGQAIPGLDPVKVKTIPIHRAVTSQSSGRSDGMGTPSAANVAAALPLSDIAPVRVQTMRIGPAGEMTPTSPAGDVPTK